MKSIVIIAAASSIAASFATTANADPVRINDPIATEQVSYADLDLKSVDGQKRLKDRITFTAYRLCLVDPGASPSPAFPDPGCFKRAINNGVAQMERAVAAAQKDQMLASATPQHR